MPPKRQAAGTIAEPSAKRTSLGANTSAQPTTAGADAPATATIDNDAITAKLDYRTLSRPHWSMREPTEEEEENEDPEVRKKREEEAEKYDDKPASQYPDWPYIISGHAELRAETYGLQMMKRNQDVFCMHVSNDFSGYGIQETIENWLVEFNALFAKWEKIEKDKAHPGSQMEAVELWIQISALVYLLAGRDLGDWMMLDDGRRWGMTNGVLGVAMLTTMNALERAGLLKKDSPIRDLGLGVALMGNYILDCLSMVGKVQTVTGKQEEEVWPYVLVRYAKENGIEIKGVHDIEERFVKKFDDEVMAGKWKAKAAVDRWGWKTKYRLLAQSYGRPKLGGNKFDVFKMSVSARKDAFFGGGDPKDPVDPKNPRNAGRLDMFKRIEQRLKSQAEKLQK